MRNPNRIPFFLILILFAAGTLTGCGQLMDAIDEKSKISEARKRVEVVMEGILADKSQIGNERVRAIGYFWQGSKVLNMDERELDAFDAWLKAKKIYPSIKSYEITGVELEEEGFGDPIVSVTVNGKKKLKIKCPDRRALQWTK